MEKAADSEGFARAGLDERLRRRFEDYVAMERRPQRRFVSNRMPKRFRRVANLERRRDVDELFVRRNEGNDVRLPVVRASEKRARLVGGVGLHYVATVERVADEKSRGYGGKPCRADLEERGRFRKENYVEVERRSERRFVYDSVQDKLRGLGNVEKGPQDDQVFVRRKNGREVFVPFIRELEQERVREVGRVRDENGED